MDITIKGKVRDSNLELLRILAMIFILVLHSNFSGIGAPKFVEVSNNVGISFVRNFVESLALVGVNCFIFISGWFGIRPKVLSFIKLIFQCLFLYFLIYIIYAFIEPHEINISSTINCFNFFNRWFLLAYFGLYLLSPVLNSFVEQSSQKQYKIVLISIGLLLLCICWLLKHYYEITSFIFIYLLARYIKKYGGLFFSYSKRIDILVYLICTALTALLMMFSELLSHGPSILGDYNAPFVFIASMYLFLFFTKLKLQNKVINWIAESAFAVYLINCNSFLRPIYTLISKYLFSSYSFVYFCVFILFFILCFFIVCILIDKFRILVWNTIMKEIDSQRIKGELI
jgi:hypothetical protein